VGSTARSPTPYPQRDHAVSVDGRHVDLAPAGRGHNQVRAAQRRNDAAALGAVRVEAAEGAVELAQAPRAGMPGEERERAGRELGRQHGAAPARVELERVRAPQAAAALAARAAVGVHAAGLAGRLGQRAVAPIRRSSTTPALRVAAALPIAAASCPTSAGLGRLGEPRSA
jgi:hypothetical protein